MKCNFSSANVYVLYFLKSRNEVAGANISSDCGHVMYGDSSWLCQRYGQRKLVSILYFTENLLHKPIGIRIKKICNDKNVKNNEQMKNIVRVVVTYQFS